MEIVNAIGEGLRTVLSWIKIIIKDAPWLFGLSAGGILLFCIKIIKAIVRNR